MSWIGLIGLLYIAYEMIKALRFNVNVVRYEKTKQIKITKELLQKQSNHFTVNRLIVIGIVTVLVVIIQWLSNQAILVSSLLGVLTVVESNRAMQHKSKTWE